MEKWSNFSLAMAGVDRDTAKTTVIRIARSVSASFRTNPVPPSMLSTIPMSTNADRDLSN